MELDHRTGIELRHVRYFLAVARHGHFGRAADAMHVSQPALSQQIRDLERIIGANLFERHSKGARLTPAGEAFARHAEAALIAVNTGVEGARLASRTVGGRVIVGLAESAEAIRIATDAIDRLRSAHEAMVVETTGLPWLEQPAALKAGIIDVGFCWSPGSGEPQSGCYGEGIAAKRLMFDPGDHALLPAGHPLAGLAMLEVAALKTAAFGLFPAELHPALHNAVSSAIHDAGLGPIVPAEGVTSVAGSVPLMVARRGWTIVTRSFASSTFPGMVIRPITGFSVPAGLDVIWPEGRRSPAIDAFVRTVIELAAPA